MADIIRTAIRIALFFMSGSFILWAAMPEWRPVMAGLLLGSLVSITNALLLRKRVETLGDERLEGRRRMGLGLASRLAMVLLAVMVAYRFPLLINLPATLSACFLIQLVAPLAALYNIRRQDR